ncbi:hypothetical protein KC19_1G022500 [Ceratodon purpureus]|uniref:BHLH domain-containing protein n=1 Tax=Ceratodon purpureus TaxID=3225 RepID=A0A8T0J2X2_CERPU|nr:hypothetical protein KC19_1G022500 [Ceratodon purpureus]
MFSNRLGMHHKLRHLGDGIEIPPGSGVSQERLASPLEAAAYASSSLKNLHQTPVGEPAMNHHKAESRGNSASHFSDQFWLPQDAFSGGMSDQNGNALVFNTAHNANGSGARSMWRSHEVGHAGDQPGGVDCIVSNQGSPGLGSPHGQEDGAMELPAISSDTADGKPESNETGNGGKRSHSRCVASKNLVSERKRRKKLNEGLFQLRSQVPKISKMDKASIIGDAIDYVRELQKELEEIESEIDDLEQKCTGSVGDEAGSVEAATGENFSGPTSSNPGSGAELVQGSGEPGQETTVTIESTVDKVSGDSTQVQLPGRLAQKILEVDVVRLEEQTYHLRIFCQRGPGVLVQLVQAVESLGVQVLNAHHTAFQENILNSFIAEMKDPEMETEDVRRTIFSVAAQYGLVQG